MSDRKTIVVLFEDNQVREEVVRYASALARRMNARVNLVMLRPAAGPSRKGESDAGGAGARALERAAARVAEDGIPVRCDLLTGDPRSELIKYAATRPSFQAAVWGGDPAVVPRGSGPSPSHWIAGVYHELHCPLVTPAKR
jgi:hypothetical protein